jgi:hypothetical protein
MAEDGKLYTATKETAELVGFQVTLQTAEAIGSTIHSHFQETSSLDGTGSPINGESGAMDIVSFVASQVDGGAHHLCGIGDSPGRNGARSVFQINTLGSGPRSPRRPRRNSIDIDATRTELRYDGGRAVFRGQLSASGECSGSGG